MEIAYLLTKGEFDKLDTVTSWSTEKFLTLGEYLLRKRIIENIK